MERGDDGILINNFGIERIIARSTFRISFWRQQLIVQQPKKQVLRLDRGQQQHNNSSL